MQAEQQLPLNEWTAWAHSFRNTLDSLQIDRFELAVLEEVVREKCRVPIGFMDFRDYLSRILVSLSTQLEQLERLYIRLPSSAPN